MKPLTRLLSPSWSVRKRPFLGGVGLGLLLLGLWGLTARLDLVSPLFLPGPSTVFQALVTQLGSYGFVSDIAASTVRVGIGFAVAVGLAVPLGLVFGRYHRLEQIAEPLIDFIRYTPIPAFIPLFVLWFGIGELEKVVVIAASVFFQLVLMVATAVRRVPTELIETAQSLGASDGQVLRSVIVPAILPDLVDDLRVSMGWAWSGVMMAELVGATSGIGSVIIQGQRLLQTPTVMAAILTIGVLGVVTDWGFGVLRRRAFPWAPQKERNA